VGPDGFRVHQQTICDTYCYSKIYDIVEFEILKAVVLKTSLYCDITIFFARYLFRAGLLLYLFWRWRFMFLRSACWLSMEYTALYSRRQNWENPYNLLQVKIANICNWDMGLLENRSGMSLQIEMKYFICSLSLYNSDNYSDSKK
jgi:hypothetical protein